MDNLLTFTLPAGSVGAVSSVKSGAAAQSQNHLGTVEYSASDIRRILQQLFPHRRLVLSQFTFFNQIGVAKPTGEQFRRGRRCYRLEDILSIAAVIALKEEGIPLKNISCVPQLIQERSAEIFRSARGDVGRGCRLSGFGESVVLLAAGERLPNTALDIFLSDDAEGRLFWSYDLGLLAAQIQQLASSVEVSGVQKAA